VRFLWIPAVGPAQRLRQVAVWGLTLFRAFPHGLVTVWALPPLPWPRRASWPRAASAM